LIWRRCGLSLIIALAGSKKAVIGGDRRVITFFGGSESIEEDLYSGKITNDAELISKAKEKKVDLIVSDDRIKVWAAGDVLVGEVTEISPKLERRRRIYLVPGMYLLAEITGTSAQIREYEKGCMILGNMVTQRIAGEMIMQARQRVSEDLIRQILLETGQRTASVSKSHIILKTDSKPKVDREALLKALQDDCIKSGWSLMK
jgi:hypothetical protein